MLNYLPVAAHAARDLHYGQQLYGMSGFHPALWLRISKWAKDRVGIPVVQPAGHVEWSIVCPQLGGTGGMPPQKLWFDLVVSGGFWVTLT